MTCENCGEPVTPDGRNYRGSTGWAHTHGRVWCAHGLTKAEPIVCAYRNCTRPATVQPKQLGSCDSH